jgi:hypothetical protein
LFSTRHLVWVLLWLIYGCSPLLLSLVPIDLL